MRHGVRPAIEFHLKRSPSRRSDHRPLEIRQSQGERMHADLVPMAAQTRRDCQLLEFEREGRDVELAEDAADVNPTGVGKGRS